MKLSSQVQSSNNGQLAGQQLAATNLHAAVAELKADLEALLRQELQPILAKAEGLAAQQAELAAAQAELAVKQNELAAEQLTTSTLLKTAARLATFGVLAATAYFRAPMHRQSPAEPAAAAESSPGWQLW